MDYNSTNQKLDALINKLENITINVDGNDTNDTKIKNSLNYILNKLDFLEQTLLSKKNKVRSLLNDNTTTTDTTLYVQPTTNTTNNTTA
jgi:hypothetical protein